ncbi:MULTISPECIES: hypothetical protein [unclassified Roseitalea]|uniref:hypothetical protein n=1 Tax=unclassified Roseitalea TaxID=2639107 RepID=UPI00273FAF1C|nr:MULTISPECIES: hypothetical protein [unclassified Roseitalea]
MDEGARIRPLIQNEFEGHIGVVRACIDPPEGMYARTWGSATHDIAEGRHRHLYVTCLAVAGALSERPAYLLATDLMAWMSKADEEGIRLPLESEFDLAPGALIVHLSHSHGAPFTDPARADAPGGTLIAPYREQILTTCRAVMTEARDAMQPSVLSWTAGRCGLAYNRDLVDSRTGEILCGLNPDGPADDTVLVGRVTDAAGTITASLVNYACHPTSLGGGNRLISPDYIGAMREIVERETGGAICVFLHGADGELTPRRSFEDDTEAADQNGRELGYAAMAALSSLFPPRHQLSFAERQESGTALGRWAFAPRAPGKDFAIRCETVGLAVRDLPSVEELHRTIAATTGYARERAQRRLAMRNKIGDADEVEVPLIAWRLGESVLIGAPVEFYSAFQTELRARFPGLSIAVMNICNGYLSYLPPSEDFDRDVYPVRIAVFGRGSLEMALDKATDMIGAMTG